MFWTLGPPSASDNCAVVLAFFKSPQGPASSFPSILLDSNPPLLRD